MAIPLLQGDFERLVTVLAQYGDWRTVRSRIDFFDDLLAGSARRADLLGQLDLDGTPRGTAVRSIQQLLVFGQDRPGRETLGVLINKLIASYGDGEEADFLRALLHRYPFTTAPVASHNVARWRGKESETAVVEKIIGENTLRDICFLEQLLDIARAVVRIQGPQTGTGFLVADDLVMTNHHVIESLDVAMRCAFQFNYQLDSQRAVRPVETARIRPDGLWHTSPLAPHNATSGAFDYTIVQLADVPSSAQHLSIRSASIEHDGRVTIIQHPGGDYKKISMQNNFVEYVDDFVVQYTTSTEPGSSGSPVLNDALAVVALHHAGGQLTEPASQRRYLRNEGIRISAIVDDMRRNAPAIHARLGLSS